MSIISLVPKPEILVLVLASMSVIESDTIEVSYTPKQEQCPENLERNVPNNTAKQRSNDVARFVVSMPQYTQFPPCWVM